jgi:hypothetical protein
MLVCLMRHGNGLHELQTNDSEKLSRHLLLHLQVQQHGSRLARSLACLLSTGMTTSTPLPLARPHLQLGQQRRQVFLCHVPKHRPLQCNALVCTQHTGEARSHTSLKAIVHQIAEPEQSAGASGLYTAPAVAPHPLSTRQAGRQVAGGGIPVRMPHSRAMCLAVWMLSPVTMRTVMPARWHVATASGTSLRTGSCTAHPTSAYQPCAWIKLGSASHAQQGRRQRRWLRAAAKHHSTPHGVTLRPA